MVEIIKGQEQEKTDKLHISYSEYSKFRECGHRHLIEKYLALEEQPPSIHLHFGNSVHEALEYGSSKNYNFDQRIHHFRTSFQERMDKDMKGTRDYLSMRDFLAQGENILRTFPFDAMMEKYEIVGVEEPLYENIYGIYYFKGFVDLIVRDKKTGKIVIIDWKTSGEAWNVEKKKKDNIFLSQTRFYKYFYGRKYNIPFDQIECKYVVLNRLKNKRDISSGFGKLQTVPMEFSVEEIEESLLDLVSAIKEIHIYKQFLKAKLNRKKGNCFFCAYKEGHPLCDFNQEQHKKLLFEHGKIPSI